MQKILLTFAEASLLGSAGVVVACDQEASAANTATPVGTTQNATHVAATETQTSAAKPSVIIAGNDSVRVVPASFIPNPEARPRPLGPRCPIPPCL
jgi:hypothetical protein